MDAQTMLRFKERLQWRRREILEDRKAKERGVEEIREGSTDPEYEESAQNDHVEYTLEQISSSHRHELIQIDAALERIGAGAYGECTECGLEIPLERLEALPYALLDAECAARREKQRHGLARAPGT